MTDRLAVVQKHVNPPTSPTSSGVNVTLVGGNRVVAIGFESPVGITNVASRAALVTAISNACKDANVSAIVLRPSIFGAPAPALVRHLFEPGFSQAPSVAAVADAIESSKKPIIAAINAPCVSLSLSLALACHGIVSDASASVAFPEVKAGVCPVGGALFRLARRADTATAVRLACSGAPLKAPKALEAKLVDAVVAGAEDGVVTRAADLGASMSTNAAAFKRISSQPSQLSSIQMRMAKGMVEKGAKGMPAPAAIFNLLNVATSGTGASGMSTFTSTETKTFVSLQATMESQALRYLAVAEASAARPKAAAGGALGVVGGPGGVARVAAVLGAGTMGSGIAVNLANVGVRVRVMEPTQALLDAGMQRIEKVWSGRVAKGTLTADAKAELMSRVKGFTSVAEACQGADVVVEVVFENFELKQKVLGEVAVSAPAHALIASNTSSLDLNALAATLPPAAAARLCGTHFFSPAHVMPLLENIRTTSCSRDTIVSMMAFAKQLKKVPVLVGVCPGFAANRSLGMYVRQAEWLVEEGATPSQVDAAVRSFGFPMGPFAMLDMSGIDVIAKVREHWPADQRTHTPTFRYAEVIGEFARAKRFGMKTGGGFYDYTAKTGNAPQEAPAAAKIIADYRAKRGLKPRVITTEEIVERMLLAAAREALIIAAEGIVEDVTVVDVCWVYGFGFPPMKGGPVFWTMKKFGKQLGTQMGKYAALLGRPLGGPQAFDVSVLKEGVVARAGAMVGV